MAITESLVDYIRSDSSEDEGLEDSHTMGGEEDESPCTIK